MDNKPQKIHEKKSIIEKIQLFAQYAEMLEEPEDPDEIPNLLKDIAAHGEYVYDWIQILKKNSEELKERAVKLAKTATVQKNNADKYTEYLKTAMKAGNFDKFKAGDLLLTLVKTTSYTPKTAPTEDDFIKLNEVVDAKFNWKEEASVEDWIENKDKIDRLFVWKESIIKSNIKGFNKVIAAKKKTNEEKEIAQKELLVMLNLMNEQVSYKLNTKIDRAEK